jgi:hypothetical protein
MRHRGFVDACRTADGPDLGLDVVASRAVAQVKAHMVPVGSPDVQRLRGAAHRGEIAIFFSLTDYTPAAYAFAEAAGVALFRFAGYDGAVEPCNQRARQIGA